MTMPDPAALADRLLVALPAGPPVSLRRLAHSAAMSTTWAPTAADLLVRRGCVEHVPRGRARWLAVQFTAAGAAAQRQLVPSLAGESP